MRTMRMLGNTALLTPISKPMMSPGGIYYSPRTADDRMQYFVVAVGPGKRLKDGLVLPPFIRPGDKVLLNPNRLGVKHTFHDGTLIADIDNIEMLWH